MGIMGDPEVELEVQAPAQVTNRAFLRVSKEDHAHRIVQFCFQVRRSCKYMEISFKIKRATNFVRGRSRYVLQRMQDRRTSCTRHQFHSDCHHPKTHVLLSSSLSGSILRDPLRLRFLMPLCGSNNPQRLVTRPRSVLCFTSGPWGSPWGPPVTGDGGKCGRETPDGSTDTSHERSGAGFDGWL